MSGNRAHVSYLFFLIHVLFFILLTFRRAAGGQTDRDAEKPALSNINFLFSLHFCVLWLPPFLCQQTSGEIYAVAQNRGLPSFLHLWLHSALAFPTVNPTYLPTYHSIACLLMPHFPPLTGDAYTLCSSLLFSLCFCCGLSLTIL